MLVVVVGGFFGDEGKGKVVSYLSLSDSVDIAVRCGSINAGHTVVHGGRTWKLRVVPSAFVNERARLMIPAGALIKLDVLFREVGETNVRNRLFVDRNAGVIEERHALCEREDERLARDIGSTLQGVGCAAAERALRRLRLARDYEELRDMIVDVSAEVNEALDRGERVLVEGVQGTFLSLYHGTYPYVTSRDTTASSFLSEIGVGPRRVDEVIVVFKSYVTRVGGGPLDNELPAEEVERRGWIERASVTGRVRRAAPFNYELAKRAIVLNSATQVAVTKLDALFPEARGAREWGKLSSSAKKWLEELESTLKTPVTIISTGPDVAETIDLRADHGVLR